MHKTSILLMTLLITAGSGFAKVKGAPPMASGVPGQRSCMSSKCHGQYELNSGKAVIEISGLPEKYKTGESYEITLSMKEKGKKVFGFEVSVANADIAPVGELQVADAKHTQLIESTRYAAYSNLQFLTHTAKGIRGPKKGFSQEWKFSWQAPDSLAGAANFYFAFNAGNGNKKKTGDRIYTRSFEIAPQD